MFTPTEAAALAEASKGLVEKAIDDRVIPIVWAQELGGARRRRMLHADAVYTIAILRHLEAPLPKRLKHRIYRCVHETPSDRLWRSKWRLSPALAVEPEEAWMRPLVERVRWYAAARDRWIERREDVKGGTPVIRGTRMTVYSIAGRLEHGETVDDILGDNPDVSREAIEAAAAYARANPLVGRPGGKPWRAVAEDA
jgi:uncharacterized protein (DUF433 family)